MTQTDTQPEKIESNRDADYVELVKRVVASTTFAKTERLSSFLLFICEEALEGRSESLNEQRIGEVVFGRSRDYDSSVDGIVRTQGSRLRQKLERYFLEEGIGEPVRITIPRGRYVPIFEPHGPHAGTPPTKINTASVESPEPAPADPSPPSDLRGKKSLWWVGTTVIAVLALLLSLSVNFRWLPVAAAARPHQHPLWSNFFASNKRTLVVPGDSGLVIWEGLEKKNLSLAEFLKGDFRNASAAGREQDIAEDLSRRRYTSIVDLEAVQTLTKIATSRSADLETRYARDLRMDDLKQYNVILLGASEANPWVELYEPMLRFRLFKDESTGRFSIENVAPKNGEPPRWSFNTSTAYAVVAYLPGFRGNGNALLIGGTSMTGTDSALDFISDDSQLLPFLNSLKRTDGNIPHFEAVLGTHFVNNSAVRSQVLAWRSLDKPVSALLH